VTTNYERGRTFEYRVRDDLKASGYEVFRSAGSRSPVDLAALVKGHTLLVQCKRDGGISPLERVSLAALAQRVGARAVVADSPKRGQIRYRQLVRDGDWKK
jgi:Holliday junction resolvase